MTAWALLGQSHLPLDHAIDEGVFVSSGYRRTVQSGYHCEECEEAIFPATTRSELNWLRTRRHIVVEVAKHVSSGLDMWIVEGLDFLDKHEGHSVVITQRR